MNIKERKNVATYVTLEQFEMLKNKAASENMNLCKYMRKVLTGSADIPKEVQLTNDNTISTQEQQSI